MILTEGKRDSAALENKTFLFDSMDIIIYCDGSGGSNGDNGGWGFSAQSKSGNILHEDFGGPDGLSTNNISEYRAVIAGLKWAKNKTVGKVLILTDSTLVVEQVMRRWKCKKPHLKPCCDEAQQLLRDTFARIEWIPREQNKRADELSHAWEDPQIAATVVKEKWLK
jgi:ribonuclease HI